MSSSSSPSPPGATAPARPSRDAGGGGDLGGGDDDGGGGGGGGDGRLVKVGFGRNQAEAEMLQGLLLQEGIPSVLKRSMGFDNPDFLGAGPRDIWVHASVAPRARELLADVVSGGGDPAAAEREWAQQRLRGGEASIAKQAFWFGVAALAGIALIWLLYLIT